MTTTDTQARYLGDYPSEQLNDLLLLVSLGWSYVDHPKSRMAESLNAWAERLKEAHKEAVERETKLPFE